MHLPPIFRDQRFRLAWLIGTFLWMALSMLYSSSLLQKWTLQQQARATIEETQSWIWRGLVKENNTARQKEVENEEKEIDIVVTHCHEDLTWLDEFGSCDRIHVHIYSKCGDRNIPNFNALEECVTVHRIENCGTQEYAFFHHVQYQRERLPQMTAFLQGGALTENPHVVHDILSYIPGMTYRELTRHVRVGWPWKETGVRAEMVKKTVPHILEEEMWLTGWRSMYMAARSELLKYPNSVYAEFNHNVCNKKCRNIDCGMEVLFGPLYHCDPSLFRGQDCSAPHTHDLAPRIISEDFMKDGLMKNVNSTAKSTKRITCGDRTMLYAKSTINGVLVCVKSEGVMSAEEWNDILNRTYAENWIPSLVGSEWQKQPQWKWQKAP